MGEQRDVLVRDVIVDGYQICEQTSSHPYVDLRPESLDLFAREFCQFHRFDGIVGTTGLRRSRQARLFEQSVLEVLRELCRLRTNEYGLRIYINGEQLPRKRLDHFYDHPPAPGEHLLAWVARVFPEQEFGIIINTGEKFVHALSQEIADARAFVCRARFSKGRHQLHHLYRQL
ncbi:hypothetical protein LP419_00405 [Massilia sp. H-1]|nr:hypothetical protein LP419_00405 [Massilia sp. H-1]